jgi:hypothetical protein
MVRSSENTDREKIKWYPGVYLPRHCPGSVNDEGFVIPTEDSIYECSPDYMVEVWMNAEVVRSESSSEDLYGVSQYLRIFQMMGHNPTTGQFGLWGQWIGDDRARPHGPFNSIEGGLFIHDKMGRSRFPKYMASAATHLYSPNSDTGGGWGFYEARIECSLLGRATLSNTLMLPPNLLSFDEDQQMFEEEGGVFLGTSWVGLPIFGGSERIDEQDWDIENGKLTWTFFVDAANYSGPTFAYVPEHWSRRVDRWNALEFLEDLYQWDNSPISRTLISFVEGDITQDELHEVIGDEPWFLAQPGDEDVHESPYWVKPEQTLGYSPASPYLPTGSEMPPIPAFSEVDDNGREFLKIFPPLFPTENDVEPFVLNVQTFDVNLYNHFVDIFAPSGNLNSETTSFADFGIPIQINGWGDGSSSPQNQPWKKVGTFDSEYEDDPDFFLQAPLRPREVNGEVNVYFEWDGVEAQDRGWGQYYEIVESNVIPVGESEVPPQLRELSYGTIPNTTSLAPHEFSEEDQDEWGDFYEPDFSCYVCNDPTICDQNIYESVLDDGSKVSYRWYRFRDQPMFRDLITDYPDVYTEEYLSDLQDLIERMHREWGSSQQFIERPTTLEEFHLVEIDHGLIVSPPETKEFGWVPIVTQVEQPDGIWQTSFHVWETPLGGLNR